MDVAIKLIIPLVWLRSEPFPDAFPTTPRFKAQCKFILHTQVTANKHFLHPGSMETRNTEHYASGFQLMAEVSLTLTAQGPHSKITAMQREERLERLVIVAEECWAKLTQKKNSSFEMCILKRYFALIYCPPLLNNILNMHNMFLWFCWQYTINQLLV